MASFNCNWLFCYLYCSHLFMILALYLTRTARLSILMLIFYSKKYTLKTIRSWLRNPNPRVRYAACIKICFSFIFLHYTVQRVITAMFVCLFKTRSFAYKMVFWQMGLLIILVEARRVNFRVKWNGVIEVIWKDFLSLLSRNSLENYLMGIITY